MAKHVSCKPGDMGSHRSGRPIYAPAGCLVTSRVEGDLVVICKALAGLKVFVDLLGVQTLVSQSLVRLRQRALCPHSARSMQAALILALAAEGIQLGCTESQRSSDADHRHVVAYSNTPQQVCTHCRDCNGTEERAGKGEHRHRTGKA